MANESFVTDTHPLIHYFCGRGRKLSRKVRLAFSSAVEGKTTAIYVPSVVLWEMLVLIESNKIALNMAFTQWIDSLFKISPMILPVPFDEVTVKYCQQLGFNDDPFDRAIVATALQLGLPLITNDSEMHEFKPCALYWD